jgi:hypothetical protein
LSFTEQSIGLSHTLHRLEYVCTTEH